MVGIHPMYVPGLAWWVYTSWYMHPTYHGGYTPLLVYAPFPPWVYRHIPTYPGVPVPPYTGVALPGEGALGSRVWKPLGESL